MDANARRWAGPLLAVVAAGVALATWSVLSAQEPARRPGRSTTTTEMVLPTGSLPDMEPVAGPDEAAANQDLADLLVGMAEAEAVVATDSLGWELRVGERDGVPVMLTEDYHTDRVTVVLSQGVVTSARIG